EERRLLEVTLLRQRLHVPCVGFAGPEGAVPALVVAWIHAVQTNVNRDALGHGLALPLRRVPRRARSLDDPCPGVRHLAARWAYAGAPPSARCRDGRRASCTGMIAERWPSTR